MNESRNQSKKVSAPGNAHDALAREAAAVRYESKPYNKEKFDKLIADFKSGEVTHIPLDLRGSEHASPLTPYGEALAELERVKQQKYELEAELRKEKQQSYELLWALKRGSLYLSESGDASDLEVKAVFDATIAAAERRAAS